MFNVQITLVSNTSKDETIAKLCKGITEIAYVSIEGNKRIFAGSVHDRNAQIRSEHEINSPRFVAFCHDPLHGGVMDTNSYAKAVSFATFGKLSN